MARAKNWNACLEHVRFARLDPSRLLRLLRKTFLMFTQGKIRDDAENLLQMHLVYTFSFVVVLVTLIATLSSSSVSLELVYRLQHIKAWLDPPVSSLPRRLLQFPNHWSTFRNAFPLSCPSCESCWYENHSFHPLLFENVSILQKSINYCHQNTLSLQWLHASVLDQKSGHSFVPAILH